MMRSLLERMLLEAAEISDSEWKRFEIKNKGSIKSEFAAYTAISTADKLNLVSKGAKLQIGGIKESLKISASGDLVEVFTQAFTTKNALDNFTGNKVESVSIKGEDGVRVLLKPGWGDIALGKPPTARCIKFWMQAIAVACGVITNSDTDFNVGIDQSKNLLYIFVG